MSPDACNDTGSTIKKKTFLTGGARSQEIPQNYDRAVRDVPTIVGSPPTLEVQQQIVISF